MKINLELAWPNKNLNPNSRAHWATIAKHKKAARKEAYVETINQLKIIDIERLRTYEKLHFFIDYYAPTKNYPDTDNILAASKAMLDGIADAIGINDRQFVPHPLVRDEIIKNGLVKITICEAP